MTTVPKPATLRGPRFRPLQTVRFTKDIIRFFRECADRYGDPFVADLPLGRSVVTGDPQALKEIFTADSNIFEPLTRSMFGPLLGASSLFLITGDQHKRGRKLMLPPFHGDRMRAYGQVIQQIAHKAIEGVRPGDTLMVHPVALELSLEVIIRVVMGVEEPERVELFKKVLMAHVGSYTPPIMFSEVMRRNFGGFGPWARFQKRSQELDVVMSEHIARRRANPEGKQDILTMLLSMQDDEGKGMTDEELKDQLRTMLLAGHETTAVGITWAMHRLHTHPDTLKRLEDELRPLGPSPAPEALAKLPYLEAVCNETMRFLPIAPVFTRKLRAPMTLKGHELPAGLGVVCSVGLAHSNPVTYPEPERFRPERFLERQYSPFEYIPFGGGFRRCVGAAFALYEMKMVLGAFLAGRRYSVLHKDAQVVRRHVTLIPKEGVPLRYEGPLETSAVAA